jgi:hypothetical protein
MQNDSNSNPVPHPLDLSKATVEDSAVSLNATMRVGMPNFLNAPRDTFLNNVSIYRRQDLPSSSNQNFIRKNTTRTFQDTMNSKPEDLSITAFANSEIITSQDLSIEESKSRLTLRFMLKKSKKFCGAIRFYISKSVTANSSKFKSLMSSIKNSVKSTLEKSVPSSKSLRQITDTLVNTLKGQRLPKCLRFRGFTFTPINKRKRNKYHEGPILPIYANNKPILGTFLNPIKQPESQDPGGFQFVKPKMYECGYCYTRFYKMPLYLKHIRRHAEIIRCESCDKAFLSIINKRRHQIQCRKRLIY